MAKDAAVYNEALKRDFGIDLDSLAKRTKDVLVFTTKLDT